MGELTQIVPSLYFAENSWLSGMLGVLDAEIDGASDKVNGLELLRNVDRCPAEYLPYLAALTNAPLIGIRAELWRKQIRNWPYVLKLKGTKKSLALYLNSIGVTEYEIKTFWRNGAGEYVEAKPDGAPYFDTATGLWRNSRTHYYSLYMEWDAAYPPWAKSWESLSSSLRVDGLWRVKCPSEEKLSPNIARYYRQHGLKTSVEEWLSKVVPAHAELLTMRFGLDLGTVYLYIRHSMFAYLRKQILQRYPWCTRRVNGTWKLGTGGERLKLSSTLKIDGSWHLYQRMPVIGGIKLRQCTITSSAMLIKSINFNYKHNVPVMPQENKYKVKVTLNGAWVLGKNNILTLSNGNVRKSINQPGPTPEQAIGANGIIFDMQYPGTPRRLTRFMKLDATWRISTTPEGAIGRSAGNRTLDGTWKIRHGCGVLSQGVARKISKSMSARCRGPILYLQSQEPRKLNGQWQIGNPSPECEGIFLYRKIV